jgi:hypothetical protein
VPGDITINQSTISSNIATYSTSTGGGFYAEYTNITRELEITNSTFSYNEANQQGGGFYIINSGDTKLTVGNTLFTENSSSGSDLWSQAELQSAGYNLVDARVDVRGAFDGVGDMLATSQNPIEVNLGVLQDNGGPTLTHALLSGSAAIDAGNPDNLALDQRGAEVYGGTRDIGAFELNPDFSAALLGPLEPTIFSDENDLLGFDFASYNFVESYEHAINNGNGLSLREAVILSNNYDLELANTLYLSEGNYTLSLAGAYEDFAATGDLDILSNLNIQGAGVGKTTIDGGGIDRVFDLDGIDAQLNLNDLTLTGGKVTQQNNDDDPYAQYGGGIRASNQATLNLENTEVVGNEAKFGGGINGNISAEININNSSIANNLASQRGAAGDFMSPIAVI